MNLWRVVFTLVDLFLMPSLFEPCGLSQLIAMAYGTIPLVRETGGLNDTVQAYDEEAETGNGFSFANYNAHDLLFTYERALKIYQTGAWDELVKRAMASDYSWDGSAIKYKNIYQSISAE